MSDPALIHSTIGHLADGRVYPLVAPEGVAVPYVVYLIVHCGVSTLLSGCADESDTRAQVDIYAASYREAVELSGLAVDALRSGLTVTDLSVSESFDEEARLYRRMIDFTYKEQ